MTSDDIPPPGGGWYFQTPCQEVLKACMTERGADENREKEFHSKKHTQRHENKRLCNR
jgi:hypothetical protein